MHASHLALFVALSIGAMCIIEPPTGTGFSKTCNDLKITTDSGRISLEAACLDGKSKTRQKSTLDLSPCFEYSGNNLFQAKMKCVCFYCFFPLLANSTQWSIPGILRCAQYRARVQH